MRRVVVTGIGIVSPLGDNAAQTAEGLKAGRSGVVFAPEYAELGFKCQVHARPKADPSEHVDKRAYRFMGEGAGWAYMSMAEAIADAGLEESDISNERTGLLIGTGGPSSRPPTSPARKGPSASAPSPCPRPWRPRALRRWPRRSGSRA